MSAKMKHHLLPHGLHRIRSTALALGATLVVLLAFVVPVALSSTQAKPLDGKKVGVSLCCAFSVLQPFYDNTKGQAAFNNSGLKLTVVNANGDVQKQLTDVESFIAQDYQGVWTTLLTGDGYARLMAKAKAKKMVWVNHSGAAVTGATLNIMLPHYAAGFSLGKTAGAWLKAHPKSGTEAGVAVDTADANLKSRSKGFEAGLKATIPGIKINEAADTQGTQPTGAQVGATLLQAHPNIRIMFGWVGDEALGMLQAATEAGKTNPNDMFITTPDATSAIIEKIKQGSALQVGISFGFPFSVSAGENLMEKAMRGEKIPPTALIRPTLVTKANAAAELAAEKNPRDPKYRGRIAKQLVLVNKPTVYNGPLPNVKIPPIGPTG